MMERSASASPWRQLCGPSAAIASTLRYSTRLSETQQALGYRPGIWPDAHPLFKKRSHVRPTPAVATYAAYLAFHAGLRGAEVFRSGWFQVIDASPAKARDLLLEAKQHGLIDFRLAGDGYAQARSARFRSWKAFDDRSYRRSCRQLPSSIALCSAWSQAPNASS